MPLSQTDRAFLRQIYQNLADKPLEPGSRFYEPVYQELGLDDPVQQISTLIDFDGVESIRLFSGFRGSGKTTELFRLRQELEEQGFLVLYADALEYVNAAEPIEISDLLMALAGAFSDALQEKLGTNLIQETFWERFRTFLNREIRLKEGSLKLDAGSPAQELLGGVKTGLDLKFELKSATNFRRELQKILAVRLSELKAQVDSFFEEGIRRIREERGYDTRVVFIFDQLEQLRGTLQTEGDVIRSVQRIFSIHFDLLKIRYVHAVFTVPPWLKFILPGTAQITLLPTVHLWNNDAERTRCEEAWRAFHSMVRRRFGDDGIRRFFGEDGTAELHAGRLIEVCGGHFRDLLRLLRDAVVRATAASSLPVNDALIDAVINAGRRDYLPIAQDDARWLSDIARIRSTVLPSTEAGPVNRLARFLDGHLVLYFINGDEWYDIHPLIRDEVAEIMQAAGSASIGTG
jgi:hypothetical protein